MEQRVTSLNTKKMIAASLKRSMMHKPLSKITVSEIVTDCGINRKTFYYHFEDIPDLLKWMLEQETIEIVKQFDLVKDAEAVIAFVLDYVEQNKHMLECVHDSMGRDELRRFFRKDIFALVMGLIREAESLYGAYADAAYKEFLCDFLTNALEGQIIEVLRTRKPYDKERFIKYLISTMRSTLHGALTEQIMTVSGQ